MHSKTGSGDRRLSSPLNRDMAFLFHPPVLPIVMAGLPVAFSMEAPRRLAGDYG